MGKFFPPARGGIETVLRNLVDGFVDIGFHGIELLVFNDRPVTTTEVYRGVPLTRLARWEQVFSVPIAPTMFWWLRSRRYDILHVHVPNPLAALSVLATLPSGKLVVSYHSDIVKQRLLLRLYAPLQRRLLSRADRIVVSSSNLGASSPVLSSFREKCTVIPFGIDPGPFLEPGEDDLRERRMVRDEIGGPFILFAGRLVYYKGLQYLVEAAADLPWPVVIAGDGPMYASLKLQAHACTGRGRFIFTGGVSDRRMRALMACCEFFVLPSISSSETFGLVQLEAMASGKAVVNTSLPTGVPEVSVHEKTGLTVPPADAGALRRAMERLTGDRELRLRLGEEARRRVLEEFTSKVMAERTLRLYHEIHGPVDDGTTEV